MLPRLSSYQPYLDWIATQADRMVRLTTEWAEINSHSENVEGLGHMLQALKREFRKLPGTLQELPLPPKVSVDPQGRTYTTPLGQALSLTKRASGCPSILLSGHMDTVYPKSSSFQKCTLRAPLLNGPGVADLKGGLVVLLLALEALERSPFAPQIGWEILINPDEEIGSPGSSPLLAERARYHEIGLVFEPGLPDGAFVHCRKGSANYLLLAKGRSAHIGRDFQSGRNAILFLLPLLQELARLTDPEAGIFLNVGLISGGEALNRVPECALAHFAVRASTAKQMTQVEKNIQDLLERHRPEEGTLTLMKTSSRPPKPFDRASEQLFLEVRRSAELLGLSMDWRETGGVCDGNTLAAAGLPTIDTLGPIGGSLHTEEEYVLLDSLVPRAKLAALILMQISDGTFQLPLKGASL